jgi:hypothetical protein
VNEGKKTPLLSVILVAGSGAASIARTVWHMRQQSVQSDIEFIVVVPHARDLDDMNIGEGEFAAVRVLPVGPITERGDAAARGISIASAPIVGLIEDHSFPEPEWADALIRAHAGPWAGVGPGVENANPDTARSCVNFLLSYVAFSGKQMAGVRELIPWHNSAYKRELLIPFNSRLGHLLTWEGDLQDELRNSGHTLYFQPEARTHHANVSRFESTIWQNLHRGRVLGAIRVRREGWPGWRRLAYAAAFPLYPLVQLRHLLPVVQRQRYSFGMLVRVLGMLGPVLWAAAIGEACGILAGAGHAFDKLDDFDLHRLSHVTRKERKEIVNFADTLPDAALPA